MQGLEKTKKPTKFTQKGKDLIDENNRRYIAKAKLGGRGQAGLARFYDEGVKELLIKEDDAATCLLEGTAYFVREAGLLPSTLSDAVNFATVGALEKKGKEIVVVSIQDKVTSPVEGGIVRPLDEIVYGVKRNPSTLWSFESWYPDNIKQNIAGLNPIARFQLAAGIFASAAAGDESLHVGQFMALVDRSNNIVGIKRIDLGARERFAVSRDKEKTNSPYHASAQYQRSGQLGKDYVDYLLADQGLNRIYTMMWVNLSTQDQSDLKQRIYESSKQAITEQFRNIPVGKQQQAILDVLKVINKGAHKDEILALPKNDIEKQIDYLADRIARMDADRVRKMIDEAVKVYDNNRKELRGKIELEKWFVNDMNFLIDTLDRTDNILKNPDEAIDFDEIDETLGKLNEKLKLLVAELDKNPNKMDVYPKISVLSEVASNLIDTTILRMHTQAKSKDITEYGKQLASLEIHSKRFQSMYEISNYCLKTSKKKRLYGARIMQHVLEGEQKLESYLKVPALIKEMKSHRSGMSFYFNQVVKGFSKGERLLRLLYKRYNLPQRVIRMTPLGKVMMEEILKGNFKGAQNITKDRNFTIYDALIPDDEGKTALHYLMELGGKDKHSIDLICEILSTYIGTVQNISLDIPDNKGRTPLNLLLENKNGSAIVKAINERIKGFGQGVYTVDNLFALEKYEPEDIERLHELGKYSKKDSITRYLTVLEVENLKYLNETNPHTKAKELQRKIIEWKSNFNEENIGAIYQDIKRTLESMKNLPARGRGFTSSISGYSSKVIQPMLKHELFTGLEKQITKLERKPAFTLAHDRAMIVKAKTNHPEVKPPKRNNYSSKKGI